MSRRTKIVATLGPRSSEASVLRDLIAAGIDVVRLNFAHATPDEHRTNVATARKQAADLARPLGVLADLPGPKMRTGPLTNGEVTLEAGDTFVLTSQDVEGDRNRVSTTLEDCAAMVEPGEQIFLADGEIVLDVIGTDGGDVTTKIVRGGVLRSRKGMHIPGAEHRVQAFTDADRRALELALELKVDLVGLSFVRSAEDVARVREHLPKRGHRPLIVAKIETRAAVDRLDEIVFESDAVMVARGDLGIQTSMTRVPLIQKEIIHTCNRAGVPVITATQMLESMTRSPLPTRAEVADIANAVVDGTDALMLSEETAIGDYPVGAVQIMAETALMAEVYPNEHQGPRKGEFGEDPVSWAVANAGVLAAENLGVSAILCPTRSGSTPRRVASFRPSMPIIGLTKRSEVIGSLALTWGVVPLAAPAGDPIPKEAREDVARAVDVVKAAGLVAEGELIVVVAGSPGPRAGRTDYVRVVRA
ncbi:MAG TPA: pyruvate kinase [Actinomycetota bacterium]|nr:pyruvate kinase [Actinomycetota bacterium]